MEIDSASTYACATSKDAEAGHGRQDEMRNIAPSEDQVGEIRPPFQERSTGQQSETNCKATNNDEQISSISFDAGLLANSEV